MKKSDNQKIGTGLFVISKAHNMNTTKVVGLQQFLQLLTKNNFIKKEKQNVKRKGKNDLKLEEIIPKKNEERGELMRKSIEIELSDDVLNRIGKAIGSHGWDDIIKQLDNPDFDDLTAESAQRLMKIYSSSTSKPFPINAFTTKWNNPLTQLKYLQAFAYDDILFQDVFPLLCEYYNYNPTNITNTFINVLQNNKTALNIFAAHENSNTLPALGKYIHFIIKSNDQISFDEFKELYPQTLSSGIIYEITKTPTMIDDFVIFLLENRSPLGVIDQLRLRGLEGAVIGLKLVQENVVSIKGWAATCSWAIDVVKQQQEELKNLGISLDTILLANEELMNNKTTLAPLSSLIEINKFHSKISIERHIDWRKKKDEKEKKDYRDYIKLIFDVCDKTFPDVQYATLIGQIVGEIIESSALPIPFILHLLRNVFQALNGTNMQYIFAIEAIKKCMTKIRQWKQFGNLIVSVQKISHNNPEIIESIKARSERIPFITKEKLAIRSFELYQTSKDSRTSFANIISTFDVNKELALFQFNHFCKTKITSTLASIIISHSLAYPQSHPALLYFIDIHDKGYGQLYKNVLSNVYSLIHKWLKSPLDPIETVMFHSIGKFLGQLTIAKQKPILSKDLHVRLILETYLTTSKCCDVVLFVIYILKQSTNSIFTPNNPWISKLFGLLKAIHDILPPSSSLNSHLTMLLPKETSNKTRLLSQNEKNSLTIHDITGELLDIPNIINCGIKKDLLESYYSKPLLINDTIIINRWIICSFITENQWKMLISIIFSIVFDKISKHIINTSHALYAIAKNVITRDFTLTNEISLNDTIHNFLQNTGTLFARSKAKTISFSLLQNEFEKWRIAISSKLNCDGIDDISIITLKGITNEIDLWETYVLEPNVEIVINIFIEKVIQETKVLLQQKRNYEMKNDVELFKSINTSVTSSNSYIFKQSKIYTPLNSISNIPYNLQSHYSKSYDYSKINFNSPTFSSNIFDVDWDYNSMIHYLLSNPTKVSLETYIIQILNSTSSLYHCINSLLEGIYWCINHIHESSFDQRNIYIVLHTIITYCIENDTFSSRVYNILFSRFIHQTSPLKFPAFIHIWLSLFTPSYINYHCSTSSNTLIEELQLLLQFLNEIIKPQTPISPALLSVYLTTLRLFCIIRHDFPNYLSSNHISFLMYIPHHFGQLRSIILSTIPFNVSIQHNIALSKHVNSQIPPMIQTKIQLHECQSIIDVFLSNGNERLLEPIQQLLNNQDYLQFVVYLIIQKDTKMCSDNVSRLLYYLLLTSSNDNRYLLLNALIDNLRYYNSHTTYIYLLITTLFDSNDIIAEQITRVLFERLLIPKPLQIGVVVTLFEILNVKNHNLIDKQFLKKQPKLHSLLSNISLN